MVNGRLYDAATMNETGNPRGSEVEVLVGERLRSFELIRA